MAARKLTVEYMANEAARQQTTETVQKLYDGKLRLERRNGGSKIYARTYLQGALLCRFDHPVTECKVMGAEIDRRLLDTGV